MFKKHPAGLKVLFFTEMWERFGFYLLVGILTLYMIDKDHGGLALGKGPANDVYGWFIACVYLTPLFGGAIADRFLGYRRAVSIGLALMSAGYLGIGNLHGLPAFYASLALICLGNGLVKPNVSSIVGRLYPEGSPLKDAGFNLFYMGINIGAFVCNFAAALLRNRLGWGWAFSSAGIGLLIGLATFLLGSRSLGDAAEKRADGAAGGVAAPGVLVRLTVELLLPAVAAGAAGYWLFGQPNVAFLFAVIPVALYYVVMLVRAPRVERRPIGAILVCCLVSVTFWMVYYQNGNTLTIWANDHTDRRPGVFEPVVTTLMIDEKVPADSPYWTNVPTAERPAPGTETSLISSELFQSINPGIVVFFTPVVLAFFAWLARRRREPSTPGKVAWGLGVTSLSSLLMVLAVTLHAGGTRSSPMWLFGTYAIVTLGELLLSPMGLSLVSKLSPPRVLAFMMGGWFLSLSIGGKLAGVMGGLWGSLSLRTLFLINAASLLVAAAVTAALVPWIQGVIAERERGAAGGNGESAAG